MVCDHHSVRNDIVYLYGFNERGYCSHMILWKVFSPLRERLQNSNASAFLGFLVLIGVYGGVWHLQMPL